MGGVAWTEEEDNLLKKCIEQYGEGNWHRVPHLAGLNRCRKSCRLRWLNYLRPNIKRGSFTEDEVELIIKLHKLLGNRWSLIAKILSGRTANDVKNYWNCHLSKKLSAQETNERSGRNEVVGSQTRNITGSLMSGPRTLLQPQLEESSSSMPQPPPLLPLVKEEEITALWVEGAGELGDLGAEEFQFEEGKLGGGTCGSGSKWEWDDLVLDMELWSESL
ncbi:hypothetical protein SLE2022_054510 [Rubroshorea leprosula]